MTADLWMFLGLFIIGTLLYVAYGTGSLASERREARRLRSLLRLSSNLGNRPVASPGHQGKDALALHPLGVASVNQTHEATTLPATDADLDLDNEIDRQARRDAVLEWCSLSGMDQRRTDFNELVAKHTRKLERKRGRPGA